MSQNKLVSSDKPQEIIKNCFKVVFEDKSDVYPNQNEMRKNNEFIDCILVVGHTHTIAHRAILASLSIFFKKLFTTKLEPSNQILFKLSCEFVEHSVLEDIVEFAYTKKITITNENVLQICIASHFLQIDQLVKETERLLCKFINFQCSFDFVLFAKSRDLFSLLFHSTMNSILNFDEISSSKTSQHLIFEEIITIFKEMHKYYVGQETRQQMYKFIINWVKFDPEQRESKLKILLDLIPLHSLSLKFLGENVAKEKIILNSKQTTETLLEAFNIRTSTKILNTSFFNFENNWKGGSLFERIFETEWFELCALVLTKKTRYCAVFHDDYLYLFGRTLNGKATTNIEAYYFEDSFWKKLSNKMPNSKEGACTVVLRDYIYLAGGDSCSVSKYSPEKKEWTEVKNMNKSRTDFHLLEMNNELYALGGGDKTVEKYNPEKDEWTFVADMSEGFTSFGATVYKNRIYVTGSGKTEVYIPEFDKWQKFPDLGSRVGSVFITIEDKLYAVGGDKFDGSASSDAVFVFDPVTEGWQYFCSLKKKNSLDDLVSSIELSANTDRFIKGLVLKNLNNSSTT